MDPLRHRRSLRQPREDPAPDVRHDLFLAEIVQRIVEVHRRLRLVGDRRIGLHLVHHRWTRVHPSEGDWNARLRQTGFQATGGSSFVIALIYNWDTDGAWGRLSVVRPISRPSFTVQR